MRISVYRATSTLISVLFGTAVSTAWQCSYNLTAGSCYYAAEWETRCLQGKQKQQHKKVERREKILEAQGLNGA